MSLKCFFQHKSDMLGPYIGHTMDVNPLDYGPATTRFALPDNEFYAIFWLYAGQGIACSLNSISYTVKHHYNTVQFIMSKEFQCSGPTYGHKLRRHALLFSELSH